jgi:hypothetical protein
MGKRKLRVCKGCKRKFTVGRKAEKAGKAPGKLAAVETKVPEAKPATTEAAQKPAA